MLVGTFLGVFVVPSLYVVFQRLSEWWQPAAAVEAGRPAVVHAADGSAVPAAMPTGDGSVEAEPAHTEPHTGERR
jgi:hypothetical protein